MMWRDDEERRTKWPVRLFLIGVLLFIVTGLVSFIQGKKDPRYTMRRAPVTGPVDYTRAGVGDRLQLDKDRVCRLKDLKIVFRGVEDGRLRFDAFLLQLDPDYAYVHRIDPDLAEQGFNMGGRSFRLLSWNGSRARLELIRSQ
jgi:hypothetical protein